MNHSSPCASSLEIRNLPIGELRPAPYNPRQRLRPGEPAYRKLAASLREFGLVEPLIWNERSGHVVGGHARLAILREMGVVELPVSVVRLNPAREKALNVILNNREAQARFDTDLLAEVLTELQELPEMELTGFDNGDLAALHLEPLPKMVEPEVALDEVEITLVTTVDTYTHMAPRLDSLIGEFDVVSHVRRHEA